MASALATWQRAHPTASLSGFLGCREADLWRIGLVRRPRRSQDVVETAKRIAASFEIEFGALVALLRLADVSDALQTENHRPENFLLAARDQLNRDN